MYLVDTDVLSAGAPTKAVVSIPLVHWMDRNSAGLYLSVVTVAEIQEGAAKARRLGATRKAERLTVWLDALLHLYRPRVLPIDLRVARLMGILADEVRGRGHTPSWADVAIATTAQLHGYTVLTRNVRHFGPLGVDALDPFEDAEKLQEG